MVPPPPVVAAPRLASGPAPVRRTPAFAGEPWPLATAHARPASGGAAPVEADEVARAGTGGARHAPVGRPPVEAPGIPSGATAAFPPDPVAAAGPLPGDAVEAEAERAVAGLAPREAAFAVGLLNRLRSRDVVRPGPGAAAVAAAVRRATPADCLAAAFATAPGMPPHTLVAGLRGAADVGVPFLDETAFRRIAAYLGVPFLEDPPRLAPRPLPSLGALAAAGAVPVAGAPSVRWLIAPAPRWLPALAALSCVRPDLLDGVAVTTPARLAVAFGGIVPRDVAGRLEPLHAIPRETLADRAVTPAQAGMMALTGLGLAAGWLALPAAARVSAAGALNLALLGHAGTRLAAVKHMEGPPMPRATGESAGAPLPVYSVLVPLHREARIAPQIVDALAALDYPRDRLDIQFLVEEPDRETRAALLAEIGRLGAAATVTVVPDGLPRTKPRALNVGLRRARGSLVTVFDAEDRPDPDQLRKAADRFAAGPPTLGCLQASLVIDHANDSWITRMFAIEYASLFDGILPMLSDRGWFFLLGGTSNHFRREALVAVGGWDPYNVTEDADLAVRLARAGWRLGKLDSATAEEAPLTIRAWMRQRTRWFKGWIQTWFVHNRDPVRLVREMGLRDALVFHVLVLGGFLSTLAHPVFCGLLLLYAAGIVSLAPEPTAVAIALFLANALVFVVGYGATFALGGLAMRRRGMGVPVRAIASLPLYWFLMFAALALAIREFVTRPHYWAKTSHGIARRPTAPLPPGE